MSTLAPVLPTSTRQCTYIKRLLVSMGWYLGCLEGQLGVLVDDPSHENFEYEGNLGALLRCLPSSHDTTPVHVPSGKSL